MNKTISNNMEFYCWGNRENPAILLIHGFLGSALDWAKICENLGQSYFCLAVNLPGSSEFDRSKRDFNTKLSIPLVAQELLAASSGLVDKFHCAVAYSMGARVLIAMIAQQTAIIDRLVFISSNPGIVEESSKIERACLDEKLAKRVLEDGLESFLSKWYRASVFDSLNQNPELQKELIAQRKKTNSAKWAAKLLVELSPAFMPNYWPLVESMDTESLWLAGEEDPKYVGIIKEVSRKTNRAKTKVVREAGHSLHFEKTEELTLILRDYLASG